MKSMMTLGWGWGGGGGGGVSGPGDVTDVWWNEKHLNYEHDISATFV